MKKFNLTKLLKVKRIYFNLVLSKLVELNEKSDDFLTKDDFLEGLPTEEDIAFLKSWDKIEPKKEVKNEFTQNGSEINI